MIEFTRVSYDPLMLNTKKVKLLDHAVRIENVDEQFVRAMHAHAGEVGREHLANIPPYLTHTIALNTR